MILWRNIENYHFFIILLPTPDFPHFYYMLGGNLGSLLYGDVSVMGDPGLPLFPIKGTVYFDPSCFLLEKFEQTCIKLPFKIL